MFLFVIGKNKPLTWLKPLDVRPRIRCPRCQWEPKKDDRWSCNPGCGHVWNTFDTRGHCPGCGKQWRETACHSCHAWSPHDDWYEQEEQDPP